MRLGSAIALSWGAAALAAPGVAGAQATTPSAPASAAQMLADALARSRQDMAQVQAQLAAMQARLDQQAVLLAQLQRRAAATSPESDPPMAANPSVTRASPNAGPNAGGLIATPAPAQRAIAQPAKWAANTTIGGRLLFNQSHLTQRSAGAETGASGTGFNIKRLYLQVDHSFGPVFSASIVTDISNVTGEFNNGNFTPPTVNGATGAINNETLVGRGLYVKNAFLEARISPALTIRAGAAPMPWVPFIEGHYGYRQIENGVLDRLFYGYTADWGIHVLGDLGKYVSYQLSVVDGANFRNVRVTKSVDIEGRVAAQYHGAWAAIGVYTGKRGNDVQATTATPTTFRTARRADVAAGYGNARFNLGGEFFYAKNWNNITVNPALFARSQDSAQGYSVFGNVNVAPKWSLFARYDGFAPSEINLPTLRDHYFNAGVQWEPVKIVDLALVYKREVVSGGAINTINGVIGCSATATPNAFAGAAAGCAGNGTYDELGIFGQVRF